MTTKEVQHMVGPLSGIRVVEFAAIGPVPHASMMLADWGADVVLVARPNTPVPFEDQLMRGRRVVEADLKDPASLEGLWPLLDAADVVLEGLRPGVMERLGLGPETCLTRNPRLIYARMTGWGQTGPWATTAGHDINYLSLTGALHAIGPASTPVPPLNLIADLGGGSMLMLAGVLGALLERTQSGRGQVVDAAMVDGVSSLLQITLDMRAAGTWTDARSDNLIDGGAPFYRTYECSDGRHVAVGALEPQFYASLLQGLGLRAGAVPNRENRKNWPALAEALESAFKAAPRDHWSKVFDGTDACVTPVLSFAEAANHPHMAARGSLDTAGDRLSARPAPRFSRSELGCPPTTVVTLEAVAASWGTPAPSEP
jgi:alpha-methylacyl-CoA racemase